jgi:hypothetical protein
VFDEDTPRALIAAIADAGEGRDWAASRTSSGATTSSHAVAGRADHDGRRMSTTELIRRIREG